jgi:hypothetical protein
MVGVAEGDRDGFAVGDGITVGVGATFTDTFEACGAAG